MCPRASAAQRASRPRSPGADLPEPSPGSSRSPGPTRLEPAEESGGRGEGRTAGTPGPRPARWGARGCLLLGEKFSLPSLSPGPRHASTPPARRTPARSPGPSRGAGSRAGGHPFSAPQARSLKTTEKQNRAREAAGQCASTPPPQPEVLKIRDPLPQNGTCPPPRPPPPPPHPAPRGLPGETPRGSGCWRRPRLTQKRQREVQSRQEHGAGARLVPLRQECRPAAGVARELAQHPAVPGRPRCPGRPKFSAIQGASELPSVRLPPRPRAPGLARAGGGSAPGGSGPTPPGRESAL